MVNVQILAVDRQREHQATLEQFLAPLKASGQIQIVGEQEENPFEAYEEKDLAVNILILLLSPAYLEDAQLEAAPLAQLLARKAQKRREYWVQPILLEACDYSHKPYADYPVFPMPNGQKTALPVLDPSWSSTAEAWKRAVEGVELGVTYIEQQRSNAPTAAGPQQKLLLLTANPKNTQALDLNIEINAIKNALRRSDYRDNFEVELSLDIQKKALLETLLQEKPRFVHFSGHGSGEDGLLFYGASGESELADGPSLAQLFRLFQKYIDCVFLNACYSEAQAKVIAQYIPYVIGTNNALSDQQAILFSEAFYMAIFNGTTPAEAFALASAQVDFQNLPPSAQAMFYEHGQLTLSQKAAASGGTPVGPSRSAEVEKEEEPKVEEPPKTEEPPKAEEPLPQPEVSAEKTASYWTDPKDGQKYPVIKIGKQDWMGRNYALALADSMPSSLADGGQLYSWEQAVKNCPAGWRLPNKSDWEALLIMVDHKSSALKAKTSWVNKKGLDSRQFAALACGEYKLERKLLWQEGHYGHFWSSTDRAGEIYKGEQLAYRLRLAYNSEQCQLAAIYKSSYFSVRYIKIEE
ncbi:FISUMP domain-containing protein [Saprospira grandis]|uniref:FISUMP domain-containing protein n=1 Tax=Saprospira grandis TaxID=1008 RepID=UPI0022DD901A|nr:FISUMP domain-containing protein [Saprospira grandis]WBM74316.1 CHAT domain-containing protein [Saprospira grandis]